ncbi:MAG TPA: hypothetical protein PK163_05520 [Steroidobacteraceae bacterium]|nr:hypothetical protein [Steroidobacteraceae bacterium]
MRLAITSLALSLLLTAVAGCKPRSHELAPGLYRAVVELPGGEVPFGLDVKRETGGFVLYLVNGKERVRVAATVDANGRLVAELPGSVNHLEATVSGDDLEGEVTLSGAAQSMGREARAQANPGAPPSGGRATVLTFSATRGPGWRFVEEPLTDNADFSGTWNITFTDDRGTTTRGVADLAQSFHTVTGTVRTAGGGDTTLAGDARDEELQLSLFDGTQAVLYHGKLDERGRLVGECWSTSSGHARYTAVRNPEATLER